MNPAPAVLSPSHASPSQIRLRRRPATAWGAMIKQIREGIGLSQRELATQAGVNRNALRRLEKEEVSGTVDVLERLADALGYELDLFGVQKILVPFAA